MKSIGIDIGTTTISFAVTDNDTLAVIQKYTIASAGFIHTENPWERIQDTDVILSRIRPVLNDILDTYSDISAIGITSQMHGIVYTDRSGRAVSPLYTWQDGRGSLPEFGGRSICRILSDDTGIKTASGYGLVTHLFNVRKGLVPADASTFCTIGDYLGMVLTGRKSPLVHISQAAGMGLFELYKLIETGTGSRKTKLIASGNAVRKNSIFQQILAERFHMPLTIRQNEEEAAYGASLCALYSSGQLSKNQLPV